MHVRSEVYPVRTKISGCELSTYNAKNIEEKKGIIKKNNNKKSKLTKR